MTSSGYTSLSRPLLSLPVNDIYSDENATIFSVICPTSALRYCTPDWSRTPKEGLVTSWATLLGTRGNAPKDGMQSHGESATQRGESFYINQRQRHHHIPTGSPHKQVATSLTNIFRDPVSGPWYVHWIRAQRKERQHHHR